MIGLAGGEFMEDWVLWEREIKMWGGKKPPGVVLLHVKVEF